MKQSKLSAFKILIVASVLFTLSSCKNSAEAPLLPNEPEFPQPISKPVKFSEPWKIKWTDSIANIKPLVKKLDFNKLPVRVFDSTGFLPFAKKPEVVSFDYDKLPDTVFNYDKLPSRPLRFETSILEPPKLIKSGHPILKTGAAALLYEFGESQGLTGIKITSLLQDRNGFLWIATDQGLYRYDGENLFHYLQVPPTFVIFTMLEDNHGNIWLGCPGSQDGGLYVIDMKAGVIKHLTTKQGLSSDVIISILSDNQGRVWVNTLPDGINIIDETTHTIKYFDRAQGLSNKIAARIIQDSKKNIWVSTFGGGLNIIDLKNGKIKFLNKEHGLKSDSLSSMLMDSLNRIWIEGNPGEMDLVDVKKGTIKHFNKEQGLSKNFILGLLNDSKGNIWIGTSGNGLNTFGKGITIIDPEREQMKLLNTSNGLAGNDIRHLLEDNFGQIWIATRTGLNLFNRNGTHIEHAGKKEITTLAEDASGQIWIGMQNSSLGVEILDIATGLARSLTTAQGLGNDTLDNIMVENRNIWIGTNDGIDLIDSSRKTIQHIGKAQGLKTDHELPAMKDKEGNIWLGTRNIVAGVDVLNLQKRTIHHLGIAQGLRDTTISDIKEDSHGAVWIGSFSGGIYIIAPERNTMKYLNDAPGFKESSDKVLLSDEKGNMWIGTNKGIYIVNAKGDSLTVFSTREGLIDDNVLSLHEYNGLIYAGTKKGITIITPPSPSQKNWQVESYGKFQGINKINVSYASDIVTKNGLFLWGDMGITVLNNQIKNKTVPNTYITGIDIFNQPQYFANKTGPGINEIDTLWSSGKDTFYLKGQLPANPSSLSMDKIQWDSVTYEYNMPVNLSLPYFKNYLQFHFTQAHLGSQDITCYSYILQGIDKKWSDKTYNPYSQNYLNLPPGEYQFKVASLFRGKWGDPVEFRFAITPPWWRTWWAYSLYIIVLAGLVWAFAQYRSRQLKRENLLLEEKITLRTNQLKHSLEELKSAQAQLIQSEKMASLGELTAGIAHEIQNPLNFVNNFSDVNKELLVEMKDEMDKGNIVDAKAIADDVIDNEEKINHHGKRADAIVKGMLQHSRQTSGVKEPTDINALCDEYLRLSYHGLRAKDKSFNAIIKTDFDNTIGKINIIPQDIGRVLLNLYNNAFYAVSRPPSPGGGEKAISKPGYEPAVSVSTKKEGNKVLITVKDNGAGIPKNIVDKIFQPFFTTKPTGQGTGLGLSLAYDIVKAHGGELKVETKEGEGTSFIIQLPVA